MIDPERQEPQKELIYGIIRPLGIADIVGIKPILQTCIINSKTGKEASDEITQVLGEMEDSLNGNNDNLYLVALEDEQVIGIIGLRKPKPELIKFARTHNPAELINAYIAKDHRGGKGVDAALVRGIETEAKARGYTELVLNSEPKYNQDCRDFYNKLEGYKNVGIIKKLKGKHGNALVWSKLLVDIDWRKTPPNGSLLIA